MGCFLSCCKENSNNQSGDANERTHLLIDPVGDISSLQRDQSDNLLANYPNAFPKKADEQSALSKILRETATNVIDVAALGSHSMEQHEYLERMNKYHSKIVLFVYPPKTKCLLLDIPLPDRILSATPVHPSDLNMIKSTASKVRSALNEVRVNHGEDLVVPFCIP